MGQPHKHAELIKAWADGAEIEYKGLEGVWSRVAIPPIWHEDVEYRIKPEPVDKSLLHEAMDRAYVAMDSFNSYVVAHKAVDSVPEALALAESISKDMFSLYRLLSNKTFEAFERG